MQTGRFKTQRDTNRSIALYENFLSLLAKIDSLMWGPWTMAFIAFVSD